MVRKSKIILLFSIFFLGCTQKVNVSPQKNLETGYYYLRAKEYSLALKYFLKAKKEKNDFNTNFLIAYTLYKQKNYKDALKFINEALKYDKRNSKGLILKGDIYLALKDYSKALSLYKKVIQNQDFPNYYLAYYKIGKVYLTLGNLDKAEKYFLKSYYNNPYFIPPQKELVKIYLQKGNIKAAEKFLNNLKLLCPEDKDVKKYFDLLEKEKNSENINFLVF